MEDQAVVREVMEGIYRGFDEQGIADDEAAFQALLDDGIEPVDAKPGQQDAWRDLIQASNREAGSEGVFDTALLDQLECHLEAFRNGGEGACGP